MHEEVEVVGGHRSTVQRGSGVADEHRFEAHVRERLRDPTKDRSSIQHDNGSLLSGESPCCLLGRRDLNPDRRNQNPLSCR